MIYDPARDRLVVFSGSVIADLWELSFSPQPAWRQLTPAGPSPAGRAFHSAVYDPIGDRMIVFGGTGSPWYRNDVWALSLSEPETWTQLTPSGETPGARASHTAVYDSQGHRMIVYAGRDPYTPLYGDVWALSLDAPEAWEQIVPEGTAPGLRHSHSAVYEASSHTMYMFGGRGGSTYADTWALSLADPPTWTEITPGGDTAYPRQEQATIYAPTAPAMIVFGGRVVAPCWSQESNDVWKLSLAGGAETWTNLGGEAPQYRADHAAVCDLKRSQILIHGGASTPYSLNDLWTCPTDGSTGWRCVCSHATWSNHAVSYDPIGDRLLLSGKEMIYERPLDSETTCWSQLIYTGAYLPSGHVSHTSIYDPVRHQLVIFGGYSTSTSTYFNSVWVLPLTTLVMREITGLTPSPTPRRDHVAVYDHIADRMIIYGGDSGEAEGDVWAFDLTSETWSQIAPTGAIPPARFNHAGVFDPVGDRLVIFGGKDVSTLDDLWQLSLGGPYLWTQLQPDGETPEAREGHTAVYDPVTHGMYVFGGRLEDGTLQTGMWRLDFPGMGPTFNLWSVSPKAGGNTGHVQILATGYNLGDAVSIDLVRAGGVIIPGAIQSVGSTFIIADFDLRDAVIALYDVSVTLLDGGQAVLPAAFGVEAGIEPELNVSIAGYSVVRAGDDATFDISVHNASNVDALSTIAYVGGFPTSTTWELLNPRVYATSWPDEPPLSDEDLYPIEIEADGLLGLPLMIPRVRAGASVLLRLSLNVPIAQTFTLSAWAGPAFIAEVPGGGGGGAMMPEALVPFSQTPCFETIMKKMAELGAGAAQTVPCFSIWSEKMKACDAQMDEEVSQSAFTTEPGGDLTDDIYTVGDFLACSWGATRDAAVDCVVDAALSKGLGKLKDFWDIVKTVFKDSQVWKDCVKDPIDELFVESEVASDPNVKRGPQGQGLLKYIASVHTLTYSVLFENLPTAGLPARRVEVSDVLDGTTLDWSTFGFQSVGWGGRVYSFEAGTREFVFDVDLRPDEDLIVRVSGALDEDDGTVRCRYETLDPGTGLPPADPAVGFLPPNLLPPDGEGRVSFTVAAAAGLEEGAQVCNEASIVFDSNAPIVTNQWCNTIDATPPETHVAVLDSVQSMLSYMVEWEGADAISGVQSYSIYVSQDGGPFTRWLRTAGTSAAFRGEPGSHYAFFSTGRDSAGNEEALHGVPDTETLIAVDATDVAGSGDLELGMRVLGGNPVMGGGLDLELVIPAPGAGYIAMYDVAGRVRVRIDTRGFEPGRHRLHLGRRFEPGVYWLRLVRDGIVLTRTAVLLR